MWLTPHCILIEVPMGPRDSICCIEQHFTLEGSLERIYHNKKQSISTLSLLVINTIILSSAPAYADEIFHPADQSRVTRRSKFRLKVPFRKNNTGQKCLSYQGPKIWNSLPSDLKSTNNVNIFKHKIKENFFKKIQREEDDIYVYY